MVSEYWTGLLLRSGLTTLSWGIQSQTAPMLPHLYVMFMLRRSKKRVSPSSCQGLFPLSSSTHSPPAASRGEGASLSWLLLTSVVNIILTLSFSLALGWFWLCPGSGLRTMGSLWGPRSGLTGGSLGRDRCFSITRPPGLGMGPQQMSGFGSQGLEPDAENEACNSFPH